MSKRLTVVARDAESPLAAANASLTPLSSGEAFRDVIKHQTLWFEKLEFARRFVPYVLARGVFPDFEDTADGVDVLIERLASHFEEPESLATLRAQADSGAIGASDAITETFIATSEAAYFLGLAVGQQLGPDAFKGGVR
jgi:hypothetical protein